MPRSSAQSDFVITPAVFDPPEEVALPSEAEPIQLPRAVLRSDEASAVATKWVMMFVWIVLAALAVLTIVGPHIPGGE